LRFQRRKKNSSDQPQARGAAPELRPLPRPPRHSPGHGKPSTAPVSAVHSPVSKRPIEQQPASVWQGFGGAEPPKGAPDHASPARRERACPARAVPAPDVHRLAGPHTSTAAPWPSRGTYQRAEEQGPCLCGPAEVKRLSRHKRCPPYGLPPIYSTVRLTFPPPVDTKGACRLRRNVGLLSHQRNTELQREGRIRSCSNTIVLRKKAKAFIK
jgi:hypothetical protein